MSSTMTTPAGIPPLDHQPTEMPKHHPMDFFRTPPKMGAVIRGRAPVSSLSYHEDGDFLFVASERDSRLKVVDCLRGCAVEGGIQGPGGIKVEREGVRLVQATHHKYCPLFVGKGDATTQSPQQRNAIHYMSMYDNKILRNFTGHSGEITGLSMNPIDDCFLSASADRKVRLWNIQQAGCLAELTLPAGSEGSPHACFDSTGLVFGVAAPMAGISGHLINLYDARKYDGGAFAELKLARTSIEKAIHNKGVAPELAMELSNTEWTSLRFNTSGKQLLVTANKGLALALDGFDGTVNNVFVGEGASPGVPPTQPLAACFTPDDKTVLGGNEDGTISCWNATTGKLLRKLEGHVGRVGCVAVNPKYAQIASACTNPALWIW
mmetsp:Transcript_16790/g.24409  ORF Transcript_16790/g.24409 Transcript_16790/m.24409 type:complete len:379 (-) Transcript_16790:111-1247(-)